MIQHRFLLTAAASLAITATAPAASIVVGNASFETPVAPTTGGRYNLFANDAPNVFGAWEKFGAGFAATYDMATYGGKPGNAQGNQGATISVTDSFVFQDIANFSGGGTSDQYWEEGHTYTLTVALGRRGDSQASVDSTIDLRLFYRPNDGGAATILANTLVTVGVDSLNPTNGAAAAGFLTDYTVNYTVPTGSAAIGKPISIWFFTPNIAGRSGDFALDNVRLDGAVPEPSAALIGGLGALVLLRRRRDSR